jgi:hypothetical protein
VLTATFGRHLATVVPDERGSVTPRPHNDVRALVSLAGSVADRTVLDTTQDLHRAISRRTFRAIPGSAPVRRVHDTVSDAVYAGVRLGLRGLARAGGIVADLAAGDREVRWLEGSPGRGTALAVVHGIVGDQFPDAHPELAFPLSLRSGGRDVPRTPDGLAAAFPDASGRVAVFVHGLTEDERSWEAPRRRRRGAPEAIAHEVEQAVETATGDDPTGADEDGPHGIDTVVLPEVVAELGWTTAMVRYGTGRAIGDNGTDLAALLEALVHAWPAEVTELALIGHSMGGLVIRSAIRAGDAAGHGWPAQVGHTVSLGTPHLGSWLERAANRGTRLLRWLPEGEVVANVIDTRARGIKDLRHGALDDASWGPEVFGVDGHADLDRHLPAPLEDPPLLDGAVHHLIAGRLTTSPRHPVTRTVGDLLVTPPSALGDDGRRRLVGAQVEVLELAAGHFRLMRDPAVADHLRRWLA